MANSTARRTLEQGRAEFAYKCVEQVLNLKTFNFGSKIIDNNKIIIDGLNRRLDKNKDNLMYKDSAIYKDFIENPAGKAEEFKKANDKNKSKNDELKSIIVEYYTKYGKDYKSYVKKTPMLIKNNGLGATFAFIKSKAKDNNPYELLFRQTGDWLKNCNQICIDFSMESDLVAWIISLPSTDYRAVTVEVLAFFNWLKRFADGLIEGEDEGNGDDE